MLTGFGSDVSSFSTLTSYRGSARVGVAVAARGAGMARRHLMLRGQPRSSCAVQCSDDADTC